MEQEPTPPTAIDRLTNFAMRLSRRRLFQASAVTALGLAGPLAGLSRLLQLAPKTPNINCVPGNCSDPCDGVCNCARSSCITGGESCACTCEPVPCDCEPLNAMAQGTWFWFNNSCIFTCQCVPC